MKAVALVAAAGAVFALGLGFAGYSIARDTIALPAVALEGGKPLAPANAARGAAGRRSVPPRTAIDAVATTTRGAGDARSGTTTDDDDAGSGTSGRGGSRSGSDDSDGGKGRGRNRGRGGADD